MAQGSNTLTETYSWDTVFALKVLDINQSIKDAKTSPPHFEYTSVDGWQISASFDIWQITNGGDGKTVHFSIPITKGSLVMNGVTHAINNVQALVILELDYFDSTTKTPAADGSTFHDLKVRTTAAKVGDEVANVYDIKFNDGSTSFLVQSLLPDALSNWLNANLSIFDHVFATVNLGKYIADGQFSWVLPTATDYCFSSKDTVEESLLGVLCMTENRPIDGLIVQLSPNTIPGGQRAGYLISNNRYLIKLLKPALPFAFNGLKETDMDLSTDGQSLELINQKAVTVNVVQNGKSYTNVLEALTITIEDTYVKVYYLISTDIGDGVTAHFESTHLYNMQMQPKPNGKPTLVYVSAGTPTTNQWTTSDNTVSTVIFTLIGIIFTVVLGILTDGAAFVVGALIIGLLTGLALEAPNIISAIGTDDAPEMDLLTLNATDPIVWNGQNKFQLGSATFNGCLQLGGTFVK